MNVLSSDVHVPSGHANEGSCGLASNSGWIRSNDQKNINDQVVSVDPKSQAVQNPGLSEQIFQVSDGYNKETQCEFGMEGGMVGWWIGVMSKSNVQCRKGKVVDVDLPKFLILCLGGQWYCVLSAGRRLWGRKMQVAIEPRYCGLRRNVEIIERRPPSIVSS